MFQYGKLFNSLIFHTCIVSSETCESGIYKNRENILFRQVSALAGRFARIPLSGRHHENVSLGVDRFILGYTVFCFIL